MSDAKNGKPLRILQAFHPLRIMRPDNVRRKWIVTSLATERVQVRRHWNKELGCTEVCQCEPACQTCRDDYFTGALYLMQVGENNEQSAEQVVLHCTEQTVRSAYNLMRMRRDDGDLAGTLLCLQRVGGGNGRVSVVSVERARLTDSRPVIDVAGVVQARLRLSTDFFGRRFDADEEHPSLNQAMVPARTRDDKPRVPKGKKP